MPLLKRKLALKNLILGFVFPVLIIGFAVALASGRRFLLPPNFEELVQQAVGSDRVLLSREAEVLQVVRTDFNKRRLPWYPRGNFSTHLENAIIASEDRHFYQHFGIDAMALARALKASLFGLRRQGASTITMQLTDLIQEGVFINNQPIKKGTIFGKLLQILRALLLELRWSKSEILEAYLNLIHLRGELQGVASLSYSYFNKHPLAINPHEAALIAALVSAPNQGPSKLKAKACRVYQKQLNQKPMDQHCDPIFALVDSVLERPIQIPPTPSLAEHFARRIFQLDSKNSVVRSSIRGHLQRKVLAILHKNVASLSKKNVGDMAAIVIDNPSGEILAYVGAVSKSKHRHVDGVRAARQAGSALKPFFYAQAIEDRTLTAASILIDDPTAISWSGGVYRPTNYDHHFYGPVSVREALASSLNVPAVKTVALVGIPQTYGILKSLHFSNLKEPDFYGASLALGAVDVRLDELANSYRMLANHGIWTPLRWQSGDRKLERRIFSAETSHIITSILSDSSARAIGFGLNSPLEAPIWAAVKTGTSKDYRDNWCVGFTGQYTVAVWAGNFNAEAMWAVSGVSGAAPTWLEIVSELHRNSNSLAPRLPEGIVKKKIRHQWASYERTEYFIEGTEPSHSLIQQAFDKQVQFIFPAEGSVLIKDPKIDPSQIALFVRFKGAVPPHSSLKWNESVLGKAVSPFRIDHLEAGHHQLSIVTDDGQVLQSIKFVVRGL